MGCISMLIRLFIPLLVFPVLSLAVPVYEIFRLAVLAWRSIFSVENLEGKVVVITGAASGIGEQLAYEYAKRKARLALIDINEDRLQEVSSTARRIGSPDVICVNANVSKIQHSEQYIKQAIQHFGQLDHLVNNAGIGSPLFGLFANVSDPSLLHPVMDTNFWGSVYGTYNAIPHLKKSKGKIIVIASSIGHLPMPKSSIYNASKAALISFYETLRVESGSDIGITIVTPGVIDTPLIRGQYLSEMGNIRTLPLTSAEECAKQIVQSVSRGDAYLRVPYWISPGLLLKALYPELTSWLIRHLFFEKQTQTPRKKSS